MGEGPYSRVHQPDIIDEEGDFVNAESDGGTNASADELFEYLVVALLSVANYPLEATWNIRRDLRKVEVCDPVQLAALTEEEIVGRLTAAGFNRGEFMNDLLASRLRNVASYILAAGLPSVKEILRVGSEGEVRALLLPANGVGPAVIKNFLQLRNR